jgi:hypothetical protein
MSQTELLLKKVEGLSPDYMAQIFDFIDQLKGECPICAKNPPFNDVTLAAIQEGDAMWQGEIPTEWHHPSEDVREALKS